MASKKRTGTTDKTFFRIRKPQLDSEREVLGNRPYTDLFGIGRTAGNKRSTLSSNDVLRLQRMIGNRAVRRHLVQRGSRPGTRNSIGYGIQRSVPSEVIQAWPDLEVQEKPDPTQFGTFKCHDAVVYWVLRSILATKVEAVEALKLLQRKRGPSADWIVEALGYTTTSRVSDPDQVSVGDILFTGDTSFVAHTMVVTDSDHVRGFNNFGTFGTEGGGDQFGSEEFSKKRFWHDVKGKKQMGWGADASFPTYQVPYNTAKASLSAFIKQVETEEDYRSHMDIAPTLVKKKSKGGCFITTAVVNSKGLPDDCDELTTLRDFRDGFLTQKSNGKDLVALYYHYSPLILNAIEKETEPSNIYEELYTVISDCVQAVKRGDNEFAYKTYCQMVTTLKERFIPEITVPGYAP